MYMLSDFSAPVLYLPICASFFACECCSADGAVGKHPIMCPSSHDSASPGQQVTEICTRAPNGTARYIHRDTGRLRLRA